jgi:4-amino-4-deoxy-L-arabinose transferase-like glycosyltransferase
MVHPIRLHDAETLRLKGRAWLGWQTLVWTALGGLLLYTLGLGNHTLWDYHEPYVGGIIREMATSGDFVVPTLNGQPYLEKPPLFYAFGALLARLFGTFDPWVLRLPSGLLALATMVWTTFLGWRLSSARAGAWAGFMLGTSVLFFLYGHEAVVDMTLTAAVTFTLGLAFLAIVEPPYRQRWVPWFWASLGLTFLAKGIVGPMMVLFPVGLTLLIQSDRRLLNAFLKPSWGMLIGIGLALSWVMALYHRGGSEFLLEVFVRNSIGRFMQDPNLVPRTGRLGEHVEPFQFYLQRLPGNLLPWLALWIAAMASAIPWHRRHHLSPRTYFLPLAFGVNFLLLSLSAAKRMAYLLPVLPATFLHTALWLDLRIPRARQRMDRTLMVVVTLSISLTGFLAVGFPWYLASQGWMGTASALGLSLCGLIAQVLIVRRLWMRDYPQALDGAMLQWTAFLALVLTIAIPGLDREKWRPLLAPYEEAFRLESKGFRIVGAGLSETQLGHSSLMLRHNLPIALNASALRGWLAEDRPVAALVEPGLWERELSNCGLPATVLPTPASAHRLRERAPVLLVNRQP